MGYPSRAARNRRPSVRGRKIRPVALGEPQTLGWSGLVGVLLGVLLGPGGEGVGLLGVELVPLALGVALGGQRAVGRALELRHHVLGEQLVVAGHGVGP